MKLAYKHILAWLTVCSIQILVDMVKFLHSIHSKFYLLCYAALFQNFAYYAQIMFTEIEQFPDNSCALLANLHFL